MNKWQVLSWIMDDSSIGQNPIINNLWWNIAMDECDLDEKSLGKWQ